MADQRIINVADLLVNYSLAVKPNDLVAIRGNDLGLPLITETYRQVVRAGGHPTIVWLDDRFSEILLKEGNDEQLQYIAKPYQMILEEYDCLVTIRSPHNTRALSSVDPKRAQLMQASGRKMMETFMRRSATGSLRWVSTMFPTQAQAQEADMSYDEFADFVYSACYADQPDPVASWNKLSSMQQTLVDWLQGKEKIVVKGPNVDLKLSIAGRTFINSDGHHNMPSGEIFTGPVENSVTGWVKFTYPAIYQGREVEGVELQFEEGKVVKATATKNEQFLQSILNTDPGASYLGEFAIGTNNGINRFTKSILFDEKIGGTIHMAVGAGYPETGSTNKSSVHWDMICDMRDGGKIWVDDELFYDSGRFLVN